MNKLILGALILLSTFGFSQDTSEIECNHHILISPNPANDVIKVEGISASMKASKVEITNIEGKVVASKEVANSFNFNFSFELAGKKAGIYFIIIIYTNCNGDEVNECKSFLKV